MAGGLQPDRPAGSAARPRPQPALLGPALLDRDRAAHPTGHVPHRADGRSHGRSIRLLRGGGYRRTSNGGHGFPPGLGPASLAAPQPEPGRNSFRPRTNAADDTTRDDPPP